MPNSDKWKTSSSLFKESWSYSVGFYGVWIGYLGRRFGLFDKLASMRQEGLTPKRLASTMRLYLPAVEAWCSAAASLGYLKEKRGRIWLNPEAKDILVNHQSPYFLGGHFAYLVLRSQEYMSFEQLFLSGRNLVPKSTNTIKAFAEVTSWDHYAFLDALKQPINRKLRKLLAKGADVLDVGCGSGGFMERLRVEYPKSSFLGIDPFANEIKRSKNIGTAKSRSIMINEGSGESMAFKDQFDLVYLGESLYLMDNKEKAISNCHSALRKGGVICIIEGLIPESERAINTNEEKMIMAMQLDFVLQGHEFMKKKQIAELLRNAGFRHSKFFHLGMSFYLVAAEKN
jgi:ubiquinone/menaquinone biosynthesis C-methylase UbiE